jgi:hypothetical protein
VKLGIIIIITLLGLEIPEKYCIYHICRILISGMNFLTLVNNRFNIPKIFPVYSENIN